MGKIGVIIQREFNQRVRKKSFIITTILTPIAFVALFVIVALVGSSNFSSTRKIYVVDNSGIIAPQLESDRMIDFETGRGNLDEIRAEKDRGEHDDLFGILVIGGDVVENPKNVQLYTYQASTIDVEMSITRRIREIIEEEKLKAYDIENISEILNEVKTNVSLKAYRVQDGGEETESSSGVTLAISYIMGIIVYFFIFMYGSMVMQGVIEEKSSKVIEIIVSSVRPFQLMMGKIIGIACVALLQFAIWVVFIGLLSTVAMLFILPEITGSVSSLMGEGGMDGMMAGLGSMDPEMFSAVQTFTDPAFILKIIGWFIVYFLGGYLLYAGLFAAVGSAVSNETDAQQLIMPVTIPLLLAFLLMINVMQDPNSPLAFWGSIIPLTSPIVMMARVPYGVPAWELMLSVGLLVATFMVLVWLAGKIYRVGIFMTGKKPSLTEIIKWVRYKY